MFLVNILVKLVDRLPIVYLVVGMWKTETLLQLVPVKIPITSKGKLVTNVFYPV